LATACSANSTARAGSLHRLADRHEQGQTLLHGQPGIVAELRQRDALDVLHDEERPAALGRASFQDLGDVRVIHHGQGLAFLLETSQDRLGVHPSLDQLEGHLRRTGCVCSATQTVPMPPSPICSRSL
jgi:hypothetical protein